MENKDQRSSRSQGRYSSGHPSVTTIMSVLNKPALNNWMMKNVFEATMEGAQTFKDALKRSKEISDTAIDIGLRVHDMVENSLNPSEIDTDLFIFYKVFERWKDEHKPKIVANEVTVTSDKYYYKGTLDMLAEINGKGCLVDIKTGKYIYETVELQLSAYKQAYEEQGRGEIDELWVLLFEKDSEGRSTGDYKFQRVDYKPEVFNALVQVWNWENEK